MTNTPSAEEDDPRVFAVVGVDGRLRRKASIPFRFGVAARPLGSSAAAHALPTKVPHDSMEARKAKKQAARPLGGARGLCVARRVPS